MCITSPININWVAIVALQLNSHVQDSLVSLAAWVGVLDHALALELLNCCKVGPY